MRVGGQVPREKVVEKRVVSVGDGFSWGMGESGRGYRWARQRAGYHCGVVDLANHIAQRGALRRQVVDCARLSGVRDGAFRPSSGRGGSMAWRGSISEELAGGPLR